MRVLLLTTIVLATACGAEQRALEPAPPPASPPPSGQAVSRYGIQLRLPDGWTGRISRGLVEAANFSLPEATGRRIDLAAVRIPADGVFLRVFEFEDDFTGDAQSLPVRLEPSSFAAEDSDPRLGVPPDYDVARVEFSAGERDFVVDAVFGTRPARAGSIEAANQALATIAVAVGDFYPGTVDAPAFAAADDWHSGSSGATNRHPDYEFATAWAATVPYRDEWNALPPAETLRGLPDAGVLVWVGLSRSADPAASGQTWPVYPLPYRLSDFHYHEGWEGQIGDVPEYVLWTRVEGRYDVDVRVYFGNAEPSEAMLRLADEELARLQLPDWGPWELE